MTRSNRTTFVALALGALVLGACAADTQPLTGGDAGVAPLADAQPPTDAAALPDAGAALDAGAAPDASAPDAAAPDAAVPPGGCFTDEVTLFTSTAAGGGRAHVDPLAIVARDDGWIVLHRDLEGSRLTFLEADGRVRASVDGPYFIDGSVIDLGRSLVIVTRDDVRRVDLGVDSVARQYGPVQLIDNRAIAPHADGVLRALTTPRVGDAYRIRVTELVLDDAQPSGFTVREGLLPASAEVGVPYVYHYAFVADGLRLLGTGSLTPRDWRSLLIELSPQPVGGGQPVGWQLVDEAAWPIEPPEAVVGVSRNGRWALVERLEGDPQQYVARVLALPSDAPIPAAGATVAGRPRALVEGGGFTSVLTEQRLATFRMTDLGPTTELVFSGSAPIAAQTAGRAAVVYAVDPGASVSRLAMRCVGLP